MPVLPINGFELYYEEEGAGVPMILLGGTLSLGREEFAPQIEEFRSRFRLILPDRRGYGKSRPPERDFPLDFYRRDADDMAVLLRQIRAAPAVVLGWSEGADVALCLTRRHPDIVRSLVIWGAIAEVRDADIQTFESKNPRSWPKKVQETMDQAYGSEYWRKTWAGWYDVMRELNTRGGDAQLGEIQSIACPTLILHGSKDPLISSFHPHALHRRLKGSRLEEIPEASHNAQLGKPLVFNALVRDFLSHQG